MTGVAKHTVLNLLRDLGLACAEYHFNNVRPLFCVLLLTAIKGAPTSPVEGDPRIPPTIGHSKPSRIHTFVAILFWKDRPSRISYFQGAQRRT